jgi:hypothetical protein
VISILCSLFVGLAALPRSALGGEDAGPLSWDLHRAQSDVRLEAVECGISSSDRPFQVAARPGAPQAAPDQWHAYLPLVRKAPLPTPTVPHWVQRYLCCWQALDADCIIDGAPCYGVVPLQGGESATWLSEVLPWDIVSSTYHFTIGATGASAEFRVELFLQREAQELPLAAYTFSATGTSPYKRTVQGTDPSVEIGKDRLGLRISLVSGEEGYISIGKEPIIVWSYVEFKVG